MEGVDELVDNFGELDINRPRPVININYADYKDADVREIDELRGILIPDEGERREVVIFGEGNFTFSLAFAGLRQSWNGITSTRHKQISDDYPEPQFHEVQVKTIKYCVSNGRRLENGPDAILQTVDTIVNLQSPPPDTWKYGVDATAIPDNLHVRGKVAWFQCPWIPRAERGDRDMSTDELVVAFLQHMCVKQNRNDYVLIGITERFPYVKDYRLQDPRLLGEGLANEEVLGYQFLGADKTLVQDILRHGYKHEGAIDIHDRILQHHITLVFRKQ